MSALYIGISILDKYYYHFFFLKGGTLFGFLITKMFTDKLVKDHIFGSNGII